MKFHAAARIEFDADSPSGFILAEIPAIAQGNARMLVYLAPTVTRLVESQESLAGMPIRTAATRPTVGPLTSVGAKPSYGLT